MATRLDLFRTEVEERDEMAATLRAGTVVPGPVNETKPKRRTARLRMHTMQHRSIHQAVHLEVRAASLGCGKN